MLPPEVVAEGSRIAAAAPSSARDLGSGSAGRAASSSARRESCHRTTTQRQPEVISACNQRSSREGNPATGPPLRGNQRSSAHAIRGHHEKGILPPDHHSEATRGHQRMQSEVITRRESCHRTTTQRQPEVISACNQRSSREGNPATGPPLRGNQRSSAHAIRGHHEKGILPPAHKRSSEVN